MNGFLSSKQAEKKNETFVNGHIDGFFKNFLSDFVALKNKNIKKKSF